MNSDALLVAAGVAAVTTTAAPLLLAMGGFIGHLNVGSPMLSSEPRGQLPIILPKVSELIEKISSSSDIKKKYKDIRCLQKYTGDKDGWTEPTEKKDNSENPQITLSDDISSCLMVEHYSNKHSDDEWNGQFRLIWSLGNESEAVITSFGATTKEGKLSMDAAAYILTKTDNKWTISHKKENLKKETNEKSEISKWFPERGDAISFQGNAEHWGWQKDFEKICKENEHKKDTKKWKTGIWESKKEESGEMHKWNKDFNTWFNTLFSDWTNVKDKLKEIKGIWKDKS